MEVYFAAPLFCVAERRYNESIVAQLEDAGYDVFLPQRDGLETTEVADRDDVSSKTEMMEAIFDLDQQRVGEADVVTAVLDGRTVDEGVAVEIGLAYARDIPAIGLRTDRRAFGMDEPVNAMIHGAVETIVSEPSALIEEIDSRT